MERLGKEAEARLLRATEHAAECVNGGDAPNTAIVKAAKLHDIPVGHVQLMVNAYNTGRTAAQRAAGSTPYEKAADFELADTATCLEELYPSHAKSAAQLARDAAVSAEYAYAPHWAERRDKRAAVAAVTIPPLVEKPAAYERDPYAELRRQEGKREREKRAFEESRRILSETTDAAAAAMFKLAEYFRQPGCLPFAVVQKNAGILFGKLGESVMQQVAKADPNLERLTKSAKDHSNGRHPIDQAPYSLIDAVIAAVDKRAAAETVCATFQPKPGPSFFREGAAGPATVSSSVLGAKEAGVMAGLAGGLGLGFARDLAQGMGETMRSDADKATSKSLSVLDDPLHQAHIRQIRAKSMLADLMSNDPIISGHDPNNVANAFNDLVELAPNVADRRLVMQSLLRNYLERGALEPFEIDQLVGVDKKLVPGSQPGAQKSVMGGQPDAR